MSDKIPQAPACVFSLHLNLDGTKENHNQLQLQYHVPLDMSEKDMNEYLDKIMNVVNRRRDLYRLDQLKKAEYEGRILLENSKADLIRIHNQHQAAHELNGGSGRYKARGKDAQQVLLAKNNQDNNEAYLKRVRTQIEALETKLGITGTTNC